MNLNIHRWIALVAAALVATRADAQLDVFNNQGSPGFVAVGFGSPVTMWDDLTLTQGGLLSEISFIADPPAGNGTFASGTIELRRFDEDFNRPQGDLIATLPFSGNYAIDPLDFFSERLIIELTDLDSMGINLPTAGRIGAGIRFDTTGYSFPDFGEPEIGASPGGNWLDNSSFERSDVNGLPWRVAIAEPTPAGPGLGSYTLFETAQPVANDPRGAGGSGIDSGFFPGVGFNASRPTKLSQVGAWIDGSGTIFAAIVELSGSVFDLPQPTDLSGDDVLATRLIDLDSYDHGFGGGDVTADFDITLQPGAYAVVFGSGKFGADAEGDGCCAPGTFPTAIGPSSRFASRTARGSSRRGLGGTSRSPNPWRGRRRSVPRLTFKSRRGSTPSTRSNR